MAGGIYVEQPFYLNPKCILFGGALMSGYWFLPPKNIFMLPLLFVVAYVTMAWYDFAYNCDTLLYSGSGYGVSVIDSIFKPQRRGGDKKKKEESVNTNLVKDQGAIYKRNVYLFHLIAVVPLLMYVGIAGKKSDDRAYPALVGIALLAGVYHGYRLLGL